MPIVVAVVAIVVVVFASAWAVRRRSVGDAHSVEGYRQTLSTLQGLGARSSGRPMRLLDDEPRDLRRRAGPADRPVGRRIVDDAGAGPAPLAGPGIDRAMRAVDRRGPRPHLVVLMLVALVVAAGAAVYLTGRPHHSPGAATGTSNSAGTAGHGTGSHARHRTTTTTVPLHYQPTTSTASTASYTMPTATYAVTLSVTSGNCWVQVTNAAGTTVFAQTLAAGTSHHLTLSGRMTVNLGAPSVVSVAVDHAPVVFPTGYRGPFTMTFVPASTSAGGAGGGSHAPPAS
ncbi:MAG: DUF4115 domain-containing protein [Acidimicrobiales bacterium]